MYRTVLFVLAALTACTPSSENALDASAMEEAQDGLGRVTGAEALILRAANTLSLEVLDDVVGLDSRAAANIVERRPFATFEALDAVPYVGNSALDKLEAYGWTNWGDEIWVHDVLEGSSEAEHILAVANTLSELELDTVVELDRRAAASIVAGRPFFDLTQLDEASWVGASAFGKLLDHVLEEPPACVNDGAEPNDTFATALDPGADRFGAVATAGNPDFFLVDVPAHGTIELEVGFLHAAGDIDVRLHTPAGLRTSAGTTDSEHVTYTNASGTAEQLVLEVYLYSGDCNPYEVAVDRVDPLDDVILIAAGDDLDGRALHGSDVEVYAFTVPARSSITATFTWSSAFTAPLVVGFERLDGLYDHQSITGMNGGQALRVFNHEAQPAVYRMTVERRSAVPIDVVYDLSLSAVAEAPCAGPDPLEPNDPASPSSATSGTDLWIGAGDEDAYEFVVAAGATSSFVLDFDLAFDWPHVNLYDSEGFLVDAGLQGLQVHNDSASSRIYRAEIVASNSTPAAPAWSCASYGFEVRPN